ncbi:hypothetical protein [Streptomyces sp. MN6]
MDVSLPEDMNLVFEKVIKGTPSLTDFDHFNIIMVKVPTGDGLWQASKVFVETKAEQCR